MLLLFVVDRCITVEESLNNLVISCFTDCSSLPYNTWQGQPVFRSTLCNSAATSVQVSGTKSLGASWSCSPGEGGSAPRGCGSGLRAGRSGTNPSLDPCSWVSRERLLGSAFTTYLATGGCGPKGRGPERVYGCLQSTRDLLACSAQLPTWPWSCGMCINVVCRLVLHACVHSALPCDVRDGSKQPSLAGAVRCARGARAGMARDLGKT